MNRGRRGGLLTCLAAAAGVAPATGRAAAMPVASDAFVWIVAFSVAACAALLAWALYERRRARAVEVEIVTRVPQAATAGSARSERVSEALRQLDATLADARQAAEQQANERAKAEAALRETEERYRLAVRGAHDGLWEWNFASRRAYFSSRARSMLGYTDDELGNGVAEWRSLIHPEDLKAALIALDAHIEGRTSRLEFEHRMRHKDGGWRWIQARAAVVRHANGKPERLVGLYTDVTARRRVQQLLLDLAEGLSGLSGEACFSALVRSFAQALGVREAFVCECCDHPTTRVRMLARWKDNDFARCVEFDLAGTACEDVIVGGRALFQADRAGDRWPLERTYQRESYLGLPCFDSQGQVIGHIACADPGAMPDELPQQAILKIFAVRAGMELERRQLERERRAVGMRNVSSHIALH